MEALAAFDRQILFALNHLGPDTFTRELVVRAVATGLMYVLVGGTLYVGLRKPGGRQVLIYALASAFLAIGVGKILNQIVARDRPFVVFPQQVRHIELIVRPDSFPSIHAVAAFGLVGGVLFSRYGRWGAAMLTLALCMVAARVAAGVHWPSDVLGGALIGVTIAALWVALQRRYWPTLGLQPEGDAEAEPSGR
ncbi:MAG: phosphatase PAP2 family protein [Armatimonadota bacterium]|nr:phosphatase PAP2 family protein [Armatimonadota bacterium]